MFQIEPEKDFPVWVWELECERSIAKIGQKELQVPGMMSKRHRPTFSVRFVSISLLLTDRDVTEY
jgi:hypothetical protein